MQQFVHDHLQSGGLPHMPQGDLIDQANQGNVYGDCSQRVRTVYDCTRSPVLRRCSRKYTNTIVLVRMVKKLKNRTIVSPTGVTLFPIIRTNCTITANQPVAANKLYRISLTSSAVCGIQNRYLSHLKFTLLFHMQTPILQFLPGKILRTYTRCVKS
jgi:hypothetical protein